MDDKKQVNTFFLNNTDSELSSSNSEDDEVTQTTYLLQHAKAKKALQEKFMMVTAQAKAANIIDSGDEMGTSPFANQDTQSLLIQMDPELLHQVKDGTSYASNQSMLFQKEQLSKQLKGVQSFVENFCSG